MNTGSGFRGSGFEDGESDGASERPGIRGAVQRGSKPTITNRPLSPLMAIAPETPGGSVALACL